jgi:hypothetical protein
MHCRLPLADRFAGVPSPERPFGFLRRLHGRRYHPVLVLRGPMAWQFKVPRERQSEGIAKVAGKPKEKAPGCVRIGTIATIIALAPARHGKAGLFQGTC